MTAARSARWRRIPTSVQQCRVGAVGANSTLKITPPPTVPDPVWAIKAIERPVPEERPVPDPWAIKAVERPVNEDIRPPKAAKRTANPARVLNPRRSLCDVGEIADGYGRCCASNHTEAQECSRYQGCLCIRHVHSSRFVSRLSQQPGQMAEFPIRDKKPPKKHPLGRGRAGSRLLGSKIITMIAGFAVDQAGTRRQRRGRGHD